jgi:acetyltransferase-like isoleucine patch superfamily enzyme
VTGGARSAAVTGGATSAAVTTRRQRLPKLVRGLLFRCHHAVVGGERLMASGMPKLSIPHRGAQLVLGERVKFGKQVKFYLDSSDARIEIGSHSGINRRSEICVKSSVHIGEGCAIGWDVCITDNNYHEFEGSVAVAPVHIGDKVWIGSRALIMKGVTIGSGAVIGAGAVVTSDVPERTLVAGPQAKVIREDVSWKL